MITRRIVILGFMGCGKTTAGEELARQLNCEFVDLDSFISSQGRSVADIITVDGEVAFRELETLALRDVLHNRQVHVIALGGGTWAMPANRTIVALYDCLTVWLDTSFDTCWQRIKGAKAARPLAPDRETAKTRFEERRDSYALAERRIEVEAADNAKRVVEKLFRET